jgi:hypothetical protein
MELLHGPNQSSANSASKGRGGGQPRGRGRGGRGGCGGRGTNANTRPGENGSVQGRSSSMECQLCGKRGHTVVRCYKRFDSSFTGVERNAGATITTYGVDTNWYTDSSTSNHITGELEKLTTRERYTGGDQVHTASGSGMEISQIGHSIVHTPTKGSKTQQCSLCS